MCGAERLRGLASAEIFARLQRRNADQAAQHRAVDLGALSGLPALHDSGEDGVGRIETGAEIADRSEEHTSELQSLMRISYAVFCLKKKKKMINNRLQH